MRNPILDLHRHGCIRTCSEGHSSVACGAFRAGGSRFHFLLLLALLAALITSVPALAQGSAGDSTAATLPAGIEDQKLAAFHPLGVNDRLRVSLFDGKELTTWEVAIDLDGNVELPYIGEVSVLGLKPSEAARELTEEFKRYYRSPSVSVDVLYFGEFEIFVFGTDLVGRMRRLPTGTRLLDALGIARIPVGGNYRRIHLIRGGFDFSTLLGLLGEGNPAAVSREAEPGMRVIEAKPPPRNSDSRLAVTAQERNLREWVEARKHDPLTSVAVIDPLVAVLEGNVEAVNVLLKPGDVVYVPAPERSVEVYGTTKPGIYELLGEETLGELLYLAGSTTYRADLRNSAVERRDEEGKLTQIVVNLEGWERDLAPAESFLLQDRDVVRIVPFERRVFVMGEVYRAGAFTHVSNLTVADYIALAGGMTDDANTGWLQIIRHPRELARPEAETEVITVNFKKLQKGHAPPADYAVLPGDVIFVPHKGFRMTFQMLVQTAATIVTGFNVFSGDGTSTRPQGEEPEEQTPSSP